MAEPLPRGGQSLTRGGVALVSYGDGNVGGDATGLFVRDRRMVRALSFHAPDLRTELLSVSRIAAGQDTLLYGLFESGRDPVALVERERSVGSEYRERYTLRSFVDELRVQVRVLLGAGGSTVYGLSDPEPTDRAVAWLEGALDSGGFDREGRGSGAHTLDVEVLLTADEPQELSWSIYLDATMPDLDACARVGSNDGRLDHILRTAQFDLEALEVVDPATGGAFLAAGAPHFLAAFGRDALIAHLLSIGTGTGRAMKSLQVLAHHQGQAHDSVTLEAPGRIAHELRVGEMGVFGVEPGVPYYASIDASPLFVVVLNACWRWGASADDVRELLPAARQAIEWCRTHVDKYGFVHSIPHPSGLAHHGWKDSYDSMVRADGSMVNGDTSPAEVQGYVYEAFMALATLEEQLGEEAVVADLRAEAAALATRFDAHFRVAAPVEVALALDGEGVPLAVRASNVGHLLDSGIIDQALAAKLADRLMSAEEFSGWGVRSLATSEAAYKPFGYHVGTVWPHDNALLLRGLTRRGFHDHARRLIDALLDLADARDGQLPELISGLQRSELATPVPYLASARPQAWAAAVPLQIAISLIGLEVDAPAGRVSCQPILRAHEHLIIEDLPIGERLITIEATGTVVTVTGDIDGLEILS